MGGGKSNLTEILLEQRVFERLVWPAAVEKVFHFHGGSQKADKTMLWYMQAPLAEQEGFTGRLFLHYVCGYPQMWCQEKVYLVYFSTMSQDDFLNFLEVLWICFYKMITSFWKSKPKVKVLSLPGAPWLLLVFPAPPSPPIVLSLG